MLYNIYHVIKIYSKYFREISLNSIDANKMYFQCILYYATILTITLETMFCLSLIDWLIWFGVLHVVLGQIHYRVSLAQVLLFSDPDAVGVFKDIIFVLFSSFILIGVAFKQQEKMTDENRCSLASKLISRTQLILVYSI